MYSTWRGNGSAAGRDGGLVRTPTPAATHPIGGDADMTDAPPLHHHQQQVVDGADPDEVKFVSELSMSLQCPICYEVCTEPVITHVCHHSFCASCIAKSLEHEPYCPLCRRRLRAEDLHPNLALAGLISELPVFCKFKRFGCPAVVRYDSREHHSRECGFAPAKCALHRFGCGFTGAAQDVQRHEATSCVFAALRVYLEATETRIRTLEETVLQQQAEMARMSVAIAKYPLLARSLAAGSDGTSSPLPMDAVEDGEPAEIFPLGDIQCRRTIREHTCGVASVAYHDGTIYSGAHDGTIKVFNAETGTPLRSLAAHRETVWSLAVDARRRLFSASRDGTIKVWDMSRPHTASVSSGTGTGGGEDGLTSRVPLLDTLTSHAGKIYSLAITDDSTRMYSGSGDRTVRVWDLAAASSPSTSVPCIGLFQGHTQGVNALCLADASIAGGALLTASNDKTVKVWDRATGACTRTLALAAEVLDVAADPVSGLVFASTYDATISAFDLRAPAPAVDPASDALSAPVAVLAGHNWEVWRLQVVDGVLFSGSFDHSIKRWDTRTFEATATLKGHRGFVHALAAGHGSLISGCADRTIKIWS
ncbi:E3 ubiquitin-protein ligase traf7 [Blastocladiella emersonii ATCC 22665]|nr:E3 ubiquitin-protein ligase traf7 [Blastocladiella emersonii ATCC 22665]